MKPRFIYCVGVTRNQHSRLNDLKSLSEVIGESGYNNDNDNNNNNNHNNNNDNSSNDNNTDKIIIITIANSVIEDLSVE